jgi:A/G-specific adenine glycosylase
MEDGRWMMALDEHSETLATGGTQEDGLRCVAKGVRHVLTHQVLTADFYLWETETRPELPEDYIWIREEDIDNYGIPRLVDKLLKKLFS